MFREKIKDATPQMKVPWRKLASEAGSTLLYVIAGVVILAAVSAGVTKMTSVSTLTQVMETNKNRSYYLALSGIDHWKKTGPIKDMGITNYTENGSETTATFTLDSNNYYTLSETDNGDGTYDLKATGTVNQDGFTESSFVVGQNDITPESGGRPPHNTVPFITDFDTLEGIENPGDVVTIDPYIATGGYHQYWASFNNLGDRSHRTSVGGCWIGFYVANISSEYSDKLKEIYDQYKNVDYDIQVKVGWYKNFDYAVSGITFRWYNDSGLMLSFMRFNDQERCRGRDQDYIAHGIKPGSDNDLHGDLLVVLWEKDDDTYRWIGYALLGDPYNRNKANDPKVVGNQPSKGGRVDGMVNDDASLFVRVEDSRRDGKRYTDIKAFYGDASDNYNNRKEDGVATNIRRKRYSPQWIDSSLFPKWPSNTLDTPEDSSTVAYWHESDDQYDYMTLLSKSPTAPENDVHFIMNPAATEYTLSEDQCTVSTEKFTLDSFPADRREIGLHAMGNLNDSDRTVAFDDFAIQILGEEE